MPIGSVAAIRRSRCPSTPVASIAKRPTVLQPLFAQAWRREHEHALDRATREEFGDDEAGLDRLAEADGVGEEDAGAEPAQDRHRRFELVRKEIDPRWAAVRSDPGGPSAAISARQARRHVHARTTRRGGTIDRLDAFEWKHDAAFERRACGHARPHSVTTWQSS